MTHSDSDPARLACVKARILQLLARLRRTSFRDGLERELLVAELERTVACLPSLAERRADSAEARAAVERAFGALVAPDHPAAWAPRVSQLEDRLSLLVASEEDLLVERASAA